MKAVIVIPNFNSAAIVQRAVEMMARQTVPAGDSFRVVVVDDGSTDGSADSLSGRFGESIDLLRLPVNQGRCTARNFGTRASTGELIIFVDSDCVPPDVHFLAAHLQAAKQGADVSFGAVETPGDGFWDRLQRDASDWRERRFAQGESWTFTTQNVAIKRELFERCGGFDTVFDRHGFEDRDLFIRLANAGGSICYAPRARVVHEDRITLGSVARKLSEAGRHAARLFEAKHPAVYRRMSFSKLDCNLRPWLGYVDWISWPLARLLGSGAASWLEWRWIPFRLRAFIARAIYGLWFLHGTAQSRRFASVG